MRTTGNEKKRRRKTKRQKTTILECGTPPRQKNIMYDQSLESTQKMESGKAQTDKGVGRASCEEGEERFWHSFLLILIQPEKRKKKKKTSPSKRRSCGVEDPSFLLPPS